MVDDDQMSEIPATQTDEPQPEVEEGEPNGDARQSESHEGDIGIDDAIGEPDLEHTEEGSQGIPGLAITSDEHTVNQVDANSHSEAIPGLSPILPADLDEIQSGEEEPEPHDLPGSPGGPLKLEPTLVLPDIEIEDRKSVV